MSPARSHEWYPWSCCSGVDCYPTGEQSREPDPVYTRQGWRLHDGQIIPHSAARPSPDGQFHICRKGGDPDAAIIQPQTEAPCLWVPQGGV